MVRHHAIVSGTGRAGTTFLMQLLTALHMDTGFNSPTSGIYSNCDAGMEIDLRQPDAPYFVKSPWLCDYLDEIVQGGQVVVDHAIVPVRDLYAAAESRRRVARNAGPGARPDLIPGGLWRTTRPDEQEDVLARQLYKLIWAVARHGIPLTLLDFPRLVTDPAYLYGKIGFLLKGVTYEAFLEGFHEVSRPQLVHDFEEESESVDRSPASPT